MLRCKAERILDPIRAVSDHLSERVSLETNEDSLSFPEGRAGSSDNRVKKQDQEAYCRLGESTPNMAMNNNLMFRSMFFMNDEPRHFLAPHIPVLPNESDYFQRKPQPMNSPVSGTGVTSHQLNTVASQTVTGEISTQTVTKAQPVKQRPHTCEECGKTFLLKHHLATHIRVHTGERPHVCPECGKTFALKHCLSTHLLLHSADRPYKCNECNKSFTLKHHLVSHEKMHTRERPFECRECGQTFAQKRHLSTHLKFHSGERPFSCQVCGETFTREEHLVMHSRFHGGLQPYICSDCGAGFLRKFQLVEHERQHGRCPDACPTCGKEFLQKRTLLLHVRTCGIAQNPHIQTVMEPPSQPTRVCKDCGEAFNSAEGLALHMRLHIGDHSFLSDICSLAASLKQAAGTQTPHLVNLNKKNHTCPDCNRSFTQKHGLNQHLIRYPNGACKLKPFRCEKCGKCFSQKNHLVLHERQHMEPSERSELKHRNHNNNNNTNNTNNSGNSGSSMENAQQTLMRQLGVQVNQMPMQQQKNHLVLHERQMDAMERAEMNKHRNLNDNDQILRHMQLTEHDQQQAQQQGNNLTTLKSHHLLHNQMEQPDVKHPMDNQSVLMRHLELADAQKNSQNQQQSQIKSHHILQSRMDGPSTKHEMDSQSLMRHLELAEAQKNSQSQQQPQIAVKSHHILQTRMDASSSKHELDGQSLMRHLEIAEAQKNSQQPQLQHIKQNHHILHERQLSPSDRSDVALKHRSLEQIDSSQSSMMRHLDHTLAHNPQ